MTVAASQQRVGMFDLPPILAAAVVVTGLLALTTESVLLIALLSVFSIAAILGLWYRLSQISRQAAEFNTARERLRMLGGSSSIVSENNESFASLIDEVSDRMAFIESERDGLRAVISAMTEGIVIVDSRRRVIMMNPAARRMLRVNDTAVIGMPMGRIASESALLQNLELSINEAQACNFEIQLPDETAISSAILVHCAPFDNQTRHQSGAVAVLHDITEMRRLERMRTEFVANVSHELRTPLTSLLGYLETLESGMWDDTEQASRFLGICRKHAESLRHIVDDLLKLSRLEDPILEISAAEVDLAEICNAAIEQFEEAAGKRRIRMSCNISDDVPKIQGDRGLLLQAISNLVANAINYNREGGSVELKIARMKAGEEFVQVAVTDSGIGIPRDAINRIFERFYRVDKARSRERGGTGLGLSIVKHIALCHGASVHVESELGTGSTFYLRFKTIKNVGTGNLPCGDNDESTARN